MLEDGHGKKPWCGWMLLSLAELRADLWLRRELAGLRSPSAPSARAGTLDARRWGWQERTHLGVGSRDEKHIEALWSNWGGCAGLQIHQGLPHGLAKGWLIRVKRSSDSITLNEHFPATLEGNSRKHPRVFCCYLYVLSTGGWASRVEEPQVRC